MNDDQPWTREQREHLNKVTLEAVMNAPDDVLLAELEAQGVDTEAVAEEMRQLLLDGVERFRQKRQAAQAQRSSKRTGGWRHRPVSELRMILERTQRHINRKQALTFAYRGRTSSELSDEEVVAALESLEELGCVLSLEPEP